MWPRNASISFLLEAFIAQPIARFVMLKLHQNADLGVEQTYGFILLYIYSIIIIYELEL